MLSAGTSLGPYQIVSPLGAGGMGEVYRAHDPRLGRDVAIKVLAAELALSPHVRARFEREARTVSQLNHPHICALYDVGREGSIDYLVMELLEGETLAHRLEKGPLPVAEVLELGSQIADALDRAHRSGVVHRDLKPGNVMLTRSGAKLMDFGLAKAEAIAPPTDAQGDTPTLTRPLTAEGSIVGTFQYMAPEQLEGKDADARTDLWALGCVLYEMATGRRAFEGRSRASLIAAILERQPTPPSQLAPLLPLALDRLVRQTLAKSPDDRIQTAHDVKLALELIAESGSEPGAPAQAAPRRRGRERLAWGVAGIGLLLAGALAVAYVRAISVQVHPPTVRAYVLPPGNLSFSFDAATGGAVLSPDGTRMVVAAADSTGKKLLWIRRLDELSAQPLEGTEYASYPFWSPDSRYVGFFVPGKLRKIDTLGGPPQTVCVAPHGRGGTWNADGVILFAPDVYAGLSRVPSAGGNPVTVSKLDKSQRENSHRWPSFLPDGRHFLYWGGYPLNDQDKSGLYLGSLDGAKPQFLLQTESNGFYCKQGCLLFMRDRSLMAQPFDARAAKTTGDAFPVAEDVANLESYHLGWFSASDDGSLVYQTGRSGRMQAVWLNDAGKDAGRFSELALLQGVRLSPDGQRLAEGVLDEKTGNFDIWIVELARGGKTRFTFNPGPDITPVWSPDGSWIAYSSQQKGRFDVYRRNSTGAGSPEALLVSDMDKYVTDWSRDGRFLAISQVDSKTATLFDIVVLPLFGDRKPYAFLQTAASEGNGVFSPDGRWMAYQCDESGKAEVYITSFPQAGGKWQVSSDGGVQPRWSSDGSVLYYRSLDGRLMQATVAAKSDAVSVGTPAPTGVLLGELDITGWFFDVAPDGRGFIVLRPEKTLSGPVTLVTNWAAGIGK